jgi:hypothetical protein
VHGVGSGAGSARRRTFGALHSARRDRRRAAPRDRLIGNPEPRRAQADAGAAVAAFLLQPAVGRAADTLASLYAAAKEEGKLVLRSALDVDLNKAIAVKFNEQYPGIAVEAFKIQPGPAIERLAAEMRTGHIAADILDPNISYMPLLLDRDLVAPCPWHEVFGIASRRRSAANRRRACRISA